MLSKYENRPAEPLSPSYRRFIVTRRGEWLATLVGRNEEKLEARAQRFARGVLGSRVVGQEEFDGLQRRVREGFIPIGRRLAA